MTTRTLSSDLIPGHHPHPSGPRSRWLVLIAMTGTFGVAGIGAVGLGIEGSGAAAGRV